VGDNFKEDEMAESKTSVGRQKSAYKAFVRIPEGRRTLWKPRRWWEHNTKMYLKEIRQECVHWLWRG